jgi:hypothetical protein
MKTPHLSCLNYQNPKSSCKTYLFISYFILNGMLDVLRSFCSFYIKPA